MAGTPTNIPGLSTLGVKFGYAVETIKGTKPTAFTQIQRCNSISGITLDVEQIDASALEDEISKYVAGRQDTGGTWSVTFNLTTDVVAELEKMIQAYQTGRGSDFNTWFEVWHPSMTNAFFVVAEPPLHIPMPEIGQNELQTVEMTFTINEYKGMMPGVEPEIADAA